jgi:hypothetical protein
MGETIQNVTQSSSKSDPIRVHDLRPTKSAKSDLGRSTGAIVESSRLIQHVLEYKSNVRAWRPRSNVSDCRHNLHQLTIYALCSYLLQLTAGYS